MDQDRQIRFAIPPFFFLSSLLLGSILSGHGPDALSLLKSETAKELLGLLAATAVLIVPVGFFISALSVGLLKIGAWLIGWPTYEAHLSADALGRIWSQIQWVEPHKKPANTKLMLYAAATFDHGMLPEGIHTWLMRRWNNFNVCAHSIVAVALAHFVAAISYKHLQIGQVWSWVFSSLGIIAILLFNAVGAFRETMEMAEFQSHISQHAPSEGKHH